MNTENQTIDINKTIEEIKKLYKDKDYQKTTELCQQLYDAKEKKEIELDSDQWFDILFHLGHSLKFQKKYDQAKNIFTQLDKDFPDKYYGLEGLVQTSQHQHNWSSTIKHSLTFQEKFPNMWQSYWWTGNAHKDLDQYDESEYQFKQLIEKFPDKHQGLEGLIQLARHQQDWHKTIKLSLDFQNKFPHMLQSYWWIGNAYKDLTQYDKSEYQFNQLYQKFPSKHHGLEGLIKIAYHQKNWHKTINLSLDFQNKFPNIWQPYWWLGQAYKSLAQYDDAESQFNYLIEKFPTIYQGYQGLIDIANHQNDWDKLLEYSEKMCRVMPERINGHYHKGMALKHLKRFDETEEHFTKLSKKFPHYYQPLTGLANLYYTQRKWDKSISVLQKALLLFPTNQAVAKQLINNYLIYNEPDDALATFDKYITNHDNITNQLLLARIYQIKEGNGEYLDRLEQLYEKYPNDISVSLTYANSLINLTLE